MARILVIEDDEPVRSTLKAMLESGGNAVSIAIDGEDGIRKFQHEPFDLVICDVFMPRKEGLATVGEIRRLSASVPIISMSGSFGPELDISEKDTPGFLRMARALGATETIAKPFRMTDLLALIRKCLDATAQ